MTQRIQSLPEIQWQSITVKEHLKVLTGLFKDAQKAQGYFWPYDNHLLPDATCMQLYEGALQLKTVNSSATIETNSGRFRVQTILIGYSFGITSQKNSLRTHTIKILGSDRLVYTLKITSIR